MMDFRENLQKFHEYVRALEEERRKIEMFQRELPLCLDIVTQAIESYKHQLSGRSTATATTTTTTECSEQTTSDGPVFEEFIPLKRTCSSTREDEEDEDDDGDLGSHKNSADFDGCDGKSGSEKKSDWLSSVQLWNQSPDPASTSANEVQEPQTSQPKKVPVVEVMRNGGAFHPFQKDKCTSETAAPALPPPAAPTASACSTAERGGKKEEAGKEGGQQRKSRRCWSPELHRRFLNALDQLGGSHAATPKQIRDLMKVDGLTNDEVKSHLQKYRLHSRRPTTAVHNNATTAPAPQFVVVGGIWMPPPPEYATTGIYAPMAAPSPPGQLEQAAQRPQNQHKLSSQSEGSSPSESGVARCNSPATSSSTHTLTASPTY